MKNWEPLVSLPCMIAKRISIYSSDTLSERAKRTALAMERVPGPVWRSLKLME